MIFTQRPFQFTGIFIFSALWMVLSFWVVHQIPLHYDEAYYWVLSNHVAFGFYDHPPLTVYFIWLSRAVLGNGEYALRFPSILLQLTSIILVYTYLRELKASKNIALVWTAIYALMPLGFFWGGIAMNIDAGVITFGILSTWIFKKALSRNTVLMWILFGVSNGLGILTKFTILPVYLGLFVYLLFNAERRKYFIQKGPYLSILVTIGVLMPFLIWNYYNDFATFFFNFAIRHEPFEITMGRIRPAVELLLFSFNPIVFILSIVYLVQIIWRKRLTHRDLDPAYFLFLTMFPVFLLIGAGNLIKVQYLIALCFPVTIVGYLFFHGDKQTGDRLSRTAKIGVSSAVFVGILAISLSLFYMIRVLDDPAYAFGKNFKITENADPKLKRDIAVFVGSESAAMALEERMTELRERGEKELFVAASDYREASLMSFYAPSHPEIFALGFKEIFGRNYILFREQKEADLIGKNALFVTEYPSSRPMLNNYFKNIEALTPFYVRDNQGRVIRIFYFYFCQTYTGDDTGVYDYTPGFAR